ncbi:uncharacterized protein LOC131847123 [Achroia grisella]|uniref:uncharacterized protein LOC131847123 n=1 Tax=Achroia grisella TaxID=688607 RepID=UPI0027D30A88|nr:uncharacterized protein LOC131847123 [Achroia grisella]
MATNECEQVDETVLVHSEIQRQVEKRLREDSSGSKDADEDGFITVTRKPKRLLRSLSNNKNEENVTDNFEIIVSSKDILPKQIGMAKLLKSENITNILRIKYKGPYRLIISFKDKEDAEKLLNCQKFMELNYRCQWSNQVYFTYGVVKDIDLDIGEDEILKLFESEQEIISVRRLKRLTDKGQWVDSEVIRLCFRSPSLPSYIYGYGCRFKVETYTFPVSQCSGCWKFGHVKRACPTNKVKCPKCGGSHDNCETTQFICINCNGSHMALDKGCPLFIKEQEIRKLMSKNNCIYKQALNLYAQQKLKTTRKQNLTTVNSIPDNISSTLNRSYRDALMTKEFNIDQFTVNEETNDSDNNTDERTPNITYKTGNKPKKKKNKRNLKSINREVELDDTVTETRTNNNDDDKESNRKHKVPMIIKILRKMQQIILSEKACEEKIIMCTKSIVEEIMCYVMSVISEGDVINKIYKMFNNG